MGEYPEGPSPRTTVIRQAAEPSRQPLRGSLALDLDCNHRAPAYRVFERGEDRSIEALIAAVVVGFALSG
jgi:hypothetical protein